MYGYTLKRANDGAHRGWVAVIELSADECEDVAQTYDRDQHAATRARRRSSQLDREGAEPTLALFDELGT